MNFPRVGANRHLYNDSAKNVSLHTFVVMPNHMPGIVEIVT